MRVKNKEEFEYIKSQNCLNSNLHIDAELSEGEYVLNCKVFWKLYEDHECVISTYGPGTCDFFVHEDRLLINPIFKR